MFGRRRERRQAGDYEEASSWAGTDDADQEQPGYPEAEAQDLAQQPAEDEQPAGGGGLAGGPWDAADDYPPAERVDLGSLLVPVSEDSEVQLSMAEAEAAWVTVIRGGSGLQLQAFAAPKSSGLWEDVREELADEVARSGGSSEEQSGPFGPELRARIAPGDPAGSDPAGSGPPGALQPVRFLGVDGPRWFLRGLITGPAAASEDLAGPLEEAFSQVVVVRGDHPVPPRDMLEIRLPDQARQALAEQAEASGGQFELPDPFERGPEITETR